MPMNTAPFILRSPRINLTAGPIELVCVARQVALVPTDEEIDVETFCDPDGIEYGSTSWVLTVTALQTFDSADGVGDGLWNQLHALRKTTVAFELLPDNGAAVSSANPSATGNVRVPSIPFLDGTPGEKTEMSLTFPVVGDPVFATS